MQLSLPLLELLLYKHGHLFDDELSMPLLKISWTFKPISYFR